LVRDRRVANLFELDAETVCVIPGIDPADLQGNQAGFGVLQQPVRGFCPLKPSPHDPSSRPMDESQRDSLGRILRNPMVIELLQVAKS